MDSMPYYLTPKQERALEYFRQEIKQTGRAPIALVNLRIEFTGYDKIRRLVETFVPLVWFCEN